MSQATSFISTMPKPDIAYICNNAATLLLARTPLFQTLSAGMPYEDQVALSYARCRAVMEAYQLTVEDIRNLTPRFWQFHTDPILLMDGGLVTLLTIHTNLCAGTLAKFVHDPYIERILHKLLTFEMNGQFCLTELGHGLDAINIETQATMLSDGSFLLNTPTPQAAKFMPPTTPSGVPTVAVVFARLIIREQDRGIRPFLVPLHNGHTMRHGITSK